MMLLDPAAPLALRGSATVATPFSSVVEAMVVVDESPALLLVVTWTKTSVLGTGKAWRLRMTFTTTLLLLLARDGWEITSMSTSSLAKGSPAAAAAA